MLYTEPRHRTRACVLVDERHRTADHARKLRVARGDTGEAASWITKLRESISYWLMFAAERIQPAGRQPRQTPAPQEKRSGITIA